MYGLSVCAQGDEAFPACGRFCGHLARAAGYVLIDLIWPGMGDVEGRSRTVNDAAAHTQAARGSTHALLWDNQAVASGVGTRGSCEAVEVWI